MIEVCKYVSVSHKIRIVSAITTELVAEATAEQELSPLAATLVGRALTGAVLMASNLKEGQRLGLHFQGSGPIGSIFAEASYDGACRAYCENKAAELPLGVKQVGAGLGKGRLDVVQSLPFQKEAYRGTTELISGEIAADLAYFLNQSQQIPAIVAISVRPADKGFELAAGYIIELMPDFAGETVSALEKLQEKNALISHLIKAGASAEDLVQPFLDSFDFEKTRHPHTPFHQCVCSPKRMERALRVLGIKTLDDMLQRKEEPIATCEFCGAKYQITSENLKKARQQLSNEPSSAD